MYLYNNKQIYKMILIEKFHYHIIGNMLYLIVVFYECEICNPQIVQCTVQRAKEGYKLSNESTLSEELRTTKSIHSKKKKIYSL